MVKINILKMQPLKLLSSLSGILGVLVLTAGVFLGVALVKQEQDIRNKADEMKEHKVAVCHKTESQEKPWVQIEISENALNAHLEHGDIQGSCPSEDKDDDEDKDKDEEKPTQAPTSTPGSGAGTGGVSLATVVNVNNQTITPASEPEVEIQYIYVTTRFDFKVSFQGIAEKKPDKMLRILFRLKDEELHVYNKVVVTSDNKGIYRGTITDVRPGNYEVLIKGDGYLQKKFEVTINRGRNSFDWSKTPLLLGDFNSDNVFEAKDVAEIMSYYTEEINPVSDETKVFDIDLSGFIDMKDVNLVLDNFKVLRLEGDN